MKEKNYSSLFSKCIDLLNENGVKKRDIARDLGFINDESGAIDSVAFAKICTGALKSYKKRTVESLFNELNSLKDYSKYFSSERINISQFDIIYAFYYWSYENEVKAAIIGINKTRISSGRLIYLKKSPDGYFEEKDSHTIKSLEYINSETIDIQFYSKSKKAGSTFLSIHLGAKTIDTLTISNTTYAGAMSTDQNQYCGEGIIEKIRIEDFGSFIKKLYDSGIHSSIVNRLYKKRFDVTNIKHEMYESIEALTGGQKEPIKLIKGHWKGYFLRRLIEGPGEDGGIVKVLMIIEASGEANIHFSETEDIDVTTIINYKGFFRFPIDNSATVTVGEFQNQNNISRLILHLKPTTKKITGVITGWRTLDLGYFSSPIYFQRIELDKTDIENPKEKDLDSLILSIRPARYHHSTTMEDFTSILPELKKIEEKVFETVELCFGKLVD